MVEETVVSIAEYLYKSPIGRIMSIAARGLAFFHKPFMVYGYFNYNIRKFQKFTRMSSSVTIMNKRDLNVGDNVWVWHHSILDATEGLTIENGCQIGAWVGLFTHGSESSIRLLGDQFVHIHNIERKGYTRGRVRIGANTFIGAGSVVLPGIKIGKGCIVGAGTLVVHDIPDYSIVVGSPGKIKGSTIDLDRKYFQEYDFSESYYNEEALALLRNER